VVSGKIRAAGPADAAAIALLHWQGWRTTYADLMPAELIARRSLARRLGEWGRRLQESGIAFLAEDERGIARGFAHATPPRNPPPGPPLDLEIGYLYVDPKAKGQGLGRALVGTVAEAALAGGLRSAFVVVFAGNPAAAFYERAGARLVGEQPFELEGWRGSDLFFVWDDLGLLRAGGAG
jgi:GNAT superfamily N-acetyltransferase